MCTAVGITDKLAEVSEPDVPDQGNPNPILNNDSTCVSFSKAIEAIFGLNTSKSAGPNRLASETTLNSGVKLYNAYIHLSLFDTMCIRHGYLPAHFTNINIVRLVKNKCGDQRSQ